MLSPNTLLNKARYRVESLQFGGPRWNVYAAVDQPSSAAVLVVEHSNAEPVPAVKHEGLVRFADSFVMNGRRYDVTEPVKGERPSMSVAKLWDDFSVILMALNTVASVSNKRC